MINRKLFSYLCFYVFRDNVRDSEILKERCLCKPESELIDYCGVWASLGLIRKEPA